MSNPLQLAYRPELDGLRGLAITAVVLFHAGDLLPGGFVGVDSFFVLSGFLITRIIMAERSRGGFSYLSFFERRVRRLFPAMAAMLLCTLVAGYLILMPLDLKALSVSTLANNICLSNLYFYSRTGYFDTASNLKPLLHTWSLSLEEQFYLLFPLVVGGHRNLSTRKLAIGLCVVAILSFTCSVYFSRSYPFASFFLLPTRMWEFLTGALIAFLPNAKTESRSTADIMSVIGIAMLLASFFFFDPTVVFPGSMAAIPVVGTALVICSSLVSKTYFVAALLSFRPLRFVGLISYSLYLWHWPILVFARYKAEEFTWQTAVVSVSLSIVIAVASWRFLEQPIRRKQHLASRRSLFSFCFCVLVLLAMFSVAGHLTGGFPKRFTQDIGVLVEDTQWNGSEYESTLGVDLSTLKIPRLGESSNEKMPLDFFVWGDSHGMVMTEVFQSLAKELNLCGAIIATHGVPPVPWISKSRIKEGQDIMTRNKQVLDYLLRERPKTIFLIARWGAHFDLDLSDSHGNYNVLVEDDVRQFVDGELSRTVSKVEKAFQLFIKKLIESGSCIVLVSQVPETAEPNTAKDFLMWYVGRKAKPPSMTRNMVEHQIQQLNSVRLFKLGKSVGAIVFDPASYFFDDTGRTINFKANRAYYRDEDHLTRWGAQNLKETIKSILIK